MNNEQTKQKIDRKLSKNNNRPARVHPYGLATSKSYKILKSVHSFIRRL